MSVGDRIKDLREKNNLSQIDLATKINVSKQTLYKYENNIVTNIPSDKIELLAKFLNCSPAYLMGWEDNLTECNADLLVDVLSDSTEITFIKKLNTLNIEHRQAIYDYIDFLCKKEGR